MGTVKKQQLSIRLAGWALNDPIFHLELYIYIILAKKEVSSR